MTLTMTTMMTMCDINYVLDFFFFTANCSVLSVCAIYVSFDTNSVFGTLHDSVITDIS